MWQRAWPKECCSSDYEDKNYTKEIVKIWHSWLPENTAILRKKHFYLPELIVGNPSIYWGRTRRYCLSKFSFDFIWLLIVYHIQMQDERRLSSTIDTGRTNNFGLTLLTHPHTLDRFDSNYNKRTKIYPSTKTHSFLKLVLTKYRFC